MKFTKDNIRYGLITYDKPTHDHILGHATQDLTISGLYLWAKAFNGAYTFPRTPHDADNFNVLHFNIAPRNIPLLPAILPLIDRNKTKLVFNVDHAIDMWSGAFSYTQDFLRAIDQADYIFSTETLMAEILTDALKRTVPVIPHPCEVTKLKKLRTANRDSRIGISIHRYDCNTVLPWYALNDTLPEHWALSAIGSQSPAAKQSMRIHHLYHEIQPHLSFKPLMDFVASLYAILESYTIHSYGRLTVEAAALAVPVVGAACVSAQRLLWPDLTFDNWNPLQARKLILRLINDTHFYQHCCQYATAHVANYSLESSASRMLHFLNTGE